MFKDIFRILSDKEMLGYIFQGFTHTLVITLIAAAIGLVLGFIVAVVKITPTNKWTRIPKAICEVYTTIFRGTPVALQLFIMVFAVIMRCQKYRLYPLIVQALEHRRRHIRILCPIV